MLHLAVHGLRGVSATAASQVNAEGESLLEIKLDRSRGVAEIADALCSSTDATHDALT
jgi:hypothetical protein